MMSPPKLENCVQHCPTMFDHLIVLVLATHLPNSQIWNFTSRKGKKQNMLELPPATLRPARPSAHQNMPKATAGRVTHFGSVPFLGGGCATHQKNHDIIDPGCSTCHP